MSFIGTFHSYRPGFPPAPGLAPFHRQGRLCRLPGIIGPVPPPTRDKSIRSSIYATRKQSSCQFFFCSHLSFELV